ncbi:MAG: endonuclease/exonuclease/phosphatase family protein [Deltaproteobacteria bacterium]|nr:endonuclease/exonuclease/phosphatase family protein [Deltaproteobacteria bacterium]
MPYFSVATFNVELRSWDDAATVEAVGATEADVVCMQEVTFDWEAVLRERYAKAYPYMLFEPRKGAGGLGVLSRFPLSDLGLVTEPHGWHPAWRLGAASPAGTIEILIVHLRALIRGESGVVGSILDVGADHRDEIELFMGEDPPPALVVGDFNEGTGGDAVRYLEDLGFTNALPLFHPGQETWRGRGLAGQLGATVDHVLFDERFEPLHAWVVPRGNSDHLPVVTELELAATTDTPPQGRDGSDG